ncbi:MAG: hypothetical protein AB7S75_01400 [Desulfococcaceae bacterium]
MKKEYDFSKGERGKFYHPNAIFNFPVYLEEDVAGFIGKIAHEKEMDLSEIVNDLLRRNIGLIQSATYEQGRQDMTRTAG